MTAKEILHALDHSHDGYYKSFVSLGDPYSYLIDSRINLFRSDNNEWAIAVERLGYNPRASALLLDIFYFGNCLTNLEEYQTRFSNHYSIYLADYDNIQNAFDEEEFMREDPFLEIRGKRIELNNYIPDYDKSGIRLKEYFPFQIRIEEALRFAQISHRDTFRAADDELYKSIPRHLKKIMVLNEWYHRDFPMVIRPAIMEEEILRSYRTSRLVPGFESISYEEYKTMMTREQKNNHSYNQEIWENNRPSVYETWQLIALVLESGDPKIYQPECKPNSHWINWANSGSL